uniref:Uncharacterized protein n=1 Tax=Anopheles coluzzii TaxID=1518534 RepID=A0A6E8VMK0_ANOCL
MSQRSPIMSKHICKNPKNLFCFVCGLYTPSHHKRSIMTRPLLLAYEVHFTARTVPENYQHGPPSVCNVCNNALLRWQNGTCPKPELPFAIPMLWSASTDHATDCYFCLTRTASSPDGKTITKANASVVYPSVKSAIRPKVFSNQRAVMFHPIHSTIRPPAVSVAVTTGKVEASDSKPIAVRTVTVTAVKREESPTVKPQQQQRVVTRHSLPASQQPAPASVQLKPVPTVISTTVSGVKRKAVPDPSVMYDVTKVRLRHSEPSVVLEKSEKLVPARPPIAIVPRPVTAGTASTNAPKILNVFSLNKNAINRDSKQLILPAAKLQPKPIAPTQRPVTIEIEDDDDEEMNGRDPQDPPSPEPPLPRLVPIKQEREPLIVTKQPPPRTVPKQIAEVRVVKVERLSPTASEQKAQPTPTATRATTGFINLCDLASAPSTHNGMMVVKMPPVSEAQPKSVPAMAPKVVAAPTPVVAPTTPDSTGTNGGGGGVGGSASEQEELPHRITQSELILLLRELELPKEKSAILIDRLKKWNLLAVELVGSNRSRPSTDPAPQTVTQPSAVTTPATTITTTPVASPAAAAVSSSTSTKPTPVNSSLAKPTPAKPPIPAVSVAVTTRTQCGPYTGTVTTLTNMKDLQVRSTRAAQKPPIITSSTNSNGGGGGGTKPQEGGVGCVGETKPPIPKVITTSVTTRSAKNALDKQNYTPPARIK